MTTLPRGWENWERRWWRTRGDAVRALVGEPRTWDWVSGGRLTSAGVLVRQSQRSGWRLGRGFKSIAHASAAARAIELGL